MISIPYTSLLHRCSNLSELPLVDLLIPHVPRIIIVFVLFYFLLFFFFLRLTSFFSFFFFNDPAPPEISPLPLPDALPISAGARPQPPGVRLDGPARLHEQPVRTRRVGSRVPLRGPYGTGHDPRGRAGVRRAEIGRAHV